MGRSRVEFEAESNLWKVVAPVSHARDSCVVRHDCNLSWAEQKYFSAAVESF